MRAAAAVMVIAGAAFLIFRARDAEASVPGAGEIAYPVDNTTRARLTPAEAVEIINAINVEEALNLDPGDVLATMIVESSLNPTAYRYEAGINDASYGLMQVLFSTAQQMGYRGDPAGLYDPVENARYGMRYIRYVQDWLAQRLGRPATWDEWTSAYNGGPARVLKNWRSVNYVAKWQRARAGINVA